MRRSLLVLLLGAPTPALAATLDVPGTYSTIAKAVAAASSGDTIRVAAGSYTESLAIGGKTLTISGAGSGSTTLTASSSVTISSGGVLSMSGFTVVPTSKRAFDISSGSLSLTDVTVGPFTATEDGVGIRATGGKITIASSTFDSLVASGHKGGAIYLKSGATLSITGTTFSSDAADEGGALYDQSSSVTIASSTFTGSTAKNTGGALRLNNSATVVVTDTVFDGDSADKGGDVYADVATTFTATSSTFTSGSASHEGGSLYFSDSAATVASSTFEGANGTTGGAIYLSGNKGYSFTDVEFRTNTATNGGAIAWVPAATSTSVAIVGGAFDANEATGSGGAIYANGGSAVAISATDFTSNVGGAGGALYLSKVDEIDVTGSLFCANTADATTGGAAHVVQGGGLSNTWTNDVFCENAATTKGGGLYLDSTGAASIVNDDFLGQTASSGAAVYAKATSFTFENDLVAWTVAGSGVVTEGAGTSTLKYDDWYDNTPGDVGGLLTSASLGSTHLYEDPLLTGWSQDGVCTDDDLWPTTSSPLVDAGDPAISDPDGSVSDIGAYGGASADASLFADADADGWIAMWDCDDASAAAYPGATEVCDGVDNDCDGTVDGSSAVDVSSWYADADADGYGDPSTGVTDCEPPSGYVADGTDCDDSEPTAHPGGVEVCDGFDNDCNGLVDDGATALGNWYHDADGDGFGDASTLTVSCTRPGTDWVTAVDCDDSSALINPAATEECDALDVDEDCDGLADDADPDAVGKAIWYEDADGDGYGSTGDAYCDAPTGDVLVGGDCDDGAAAVSPGAAEVCNGVDDDCDGEVDEASAIDATVWYRDADGDGYGDASDIQIGCGQPSGYVSSASGSDCDDGDADVHPGATQVWYDGVDQDCSGGSDLDQDGDGYDDAGHGGTDCDDGDAAISPGADEIWYDGVDQDCSGGSDDDADQDGHDDAGHGGDDCDDGDATVHPGAAEVWYDGVDEACDGGDDLDQDGDGHDAAAEGGDDCDDTDASAYPGASETWYDGVDQDCSGGSDADQDGDGHDDADHGGDDCDDGDATVYPGATDVPDDGVDQNCQGGDATTGVNGGKGTGCDCDSEGGPSGTIAGLLLAIGLVARRRAPAGATRRGDRE